MPLHFNFGRLPLQRSRQYKVRSSCNPRVSDQAKSAIWMRICVQAVCVDDLYCRAQRDHQQADNSDKLLAEEPEVRIGLRRKHQESEFGI